MQVEQEDVAALRDGAEIKRRRKEIGWTQTDLARESRVGLSLVQRAERGDRRVRSSNLRSMAEALSSHGTIPAWFSQAQEQSEAALATILDRVGALPDLVDRLTLLADAVHRLEIAAGTVPKKATS